MKFKLSIDLSSDTLRAADDVVKALGKIAARFDEDTITYCDSGHIRDVNGNIIGKWKITK